MEEISRHYCIGCQKKHDEEPWRWGWIKVDKKTRYFCHNSIACEGCKTVHKRNGYSVTYTRQSVCFPGKSMQICALWAKPTPLSPRQKMKNMSPEDVLSGVPFGAERAGYFKKESRDDWSKEHSQEVGALKNTLK